MTVRKHLLMTILSLLVGITITIGLLLPTEVQAQTRPSQRQLRTYVPPEHLVSFLPTTPFDVFVDFLNPVFEEETGKQIIDPTSSTFAIGVSIAGMHFMDAMELVLDYNGLAYREGDRYFVIEDAPPASVEPGELLAAETNRPARISSREIQINAVLFELNVTKARELGMDWNVLFGASDAAGGGGSGTAANEGDASIRLKTGGLFDRLGDAIDGPESMELSTLTRLFRLLENEGIGETVANPQITVQSGEQGRIQIGSDIPVQIRDFSGNTVTQFYSTGVIVEVVPTLMTEAVADSAGAPELDFIHLDVKVEKSNGRPSLQGLVIDRNDATTQVLLLDGEQTIIGGLYSTQESVSRRGVPLLKDLPPWMLGLRYVFGYDQRTVTQKELLIVLQAETLAPLARRAEGDLEADLVGKRRQMVRDALNRAGVREAARQAPAPSGR